MYQVLFRIPFIDLPIYGFGAMLFVAFFACITIAGRRAEQEGIAKGIVQDLALWIFVPGIIGARIVYMIQYRQPVQQFFEIWKGGLVFYGSFLGGLAGYGLGYLLLLRKHGVSNLKMLDILAPTIALGLCLGRVGCLLNGCCFGNVACVNCPAIHFPLPAPPRYTYVQLGHQTAAGFTLVDWDDRDPRTQVGLVEPHSPAEQSGLRPGDRILEVNGLPNRIVVELAGSPERLQAADLAPFDRPLDTSIPGRRRILFNDAVDFGQALPRLRTLAAENHLSLAEFDTFLDLLVHNWPRGETVLELTVARAGQDKPVTLPPFEPRTLGLHPTQIYESISTFLLFLLLLAYYPLRRRDGEVMALFMLGYAVHRFLNEMLRNDTDPVLFGMTLSQNGSVVMLVAGLVLLLWPRRPKLSFS